MIEQKKIRKERIRKAVYSGAFYPEDPGELEQLVSGYLDVPAKLGHSPVHGLIVPHAGYIYSGEVAGEGYAMLRESLSSLLVNQPVTIFLLGPSHRVAVDGVAVSSADVWETPLGNIRVSEITGKVGNAPDGSVNDDAHEAEHSLEVQLPFLQLVLEKVPFEIVPMLVTDADFRSVAKLIGRYMNENDLLIVSTDLSHYLPQGEAEEHDRRTIDSISAVSIEGMVENGDACGKVPVLSAMVLAEEKRWSITEIRYKNSGDSTGDFSAVVGYVSMYFGPKTDEETL